MHVFQKDIFKNKNVFITGGSSGINLTIARYFAQYGARVAIIARRAGKIQMAVDTITREDGTAIGWEADVRDYQELRTAVENTVSKWGQLDYVIAGAGRNMLSLAVDLSVKNFRDIIDIDLNGTFNTVKACFDFLRKPNSSIIAISAVQAEMAMQYQSHVGAAKAGIEMLVKTLALEWGHMGIRVNAISPGPIENTEGMGRLTPDNDLKDRICQTIPLQRYGKTDEIANCAIFLCSDAASYITGTIITVDGGARFSNGDVFKMA